MKTYMNSEKKMNFLSLKKMWNWTFPLLYIISWMENIGIPKMQVKFLQFARTTHNQVQYIRLSYPHHAKI